MAEPTLAERYRAARRDPGLTVLEGLHALKHALRFDAEVLDARTPEPGALRELAEELAPDVADRIVELAATVEATTFARLAPSPHPTGLIALARRPKTSITATLADPGPDPIVLLERPTHHGNIGAVVRVAAAAGTAGVLVTGRHDPWHPASIRGGAGLHFALPVLSLDADGLEAVAGSDRSIIVLDPEGVPLPGPGTAGREHDHATPAPGIIPARAVLVFGSERTGVSDGLLARADRRFAIPMRPGVSSLNLATAVAIALYAPR